MSSNPENTALAVRERAPLAVGSQGIQCQSIEEMFRFAQYIAKSPFAPSGFKDPESIVVAMQYGYELGMTPMQALQNIAVINGKPSIYGDAMLALVRASGLLEEFSEGQVTRTKAGQVVCTCDEFAQKKTCVHVVVAASHVERPGEQMVAVCHVKRRGAAFGRNALFGHVEAQIAGLLNKPGPWKQYPDRMLMFRARGFGLRDEFSDVLKGLVSAEEAADYDLVMGGGHRVEPKGERVVEMPLTRTEELKARLAASRPDSAAAVDAQAPFAASETIDAAEAADLGVVIDAEETTAPGEASDGDEVEVLSTEQYNQLVARLDELGLDEERRLDLAGAFGLVDLRLIPAADFDEAWEAAEQIAVEVAAALEAAQSTAPSTDEAALVRDLAAEAEVDITALLKQFRAKSFEDLSPDQLTKARGILEARLKRK